MNITRNVIKTHLDHNGASKGRPYTEDELVALEFADASFSAEEQKELDSDWSSSSDQFHHDDFQSVIDAHDYTFVNFYADWCPHCRAFGPTWNAFEEKLNSAEEPVVDAEETCQQQKVHSFPTVRLYRRGFDKKQWVDFRGRREMADLESFARREVKQRHRNTGARFH